MQTGQTENITTTTETATLAGGVGLALIGGLKTGAKLRESRVFDLHALGVEFHGDMTFEQWMEGLKMLKMSKRAVMLWFADFLKFGRKTFGEERVEESLCQLEFEMVDARQAMAIGSMSDAVRHADLTSEHYWVLASQEPKLSSKEQQKWAALAVEHRLSALRLKKSIEAGSVVNDVAGGSGSAMRGIATIHGVRQLFDTWWTTIEKHDPIEKWSKEKQRELLEELRAPALLGMKLANELGVNLSAE